MIIKTAILVDGDFFLKRYKALKKQEKSFDPFDPIQIAKDFSKLAWSHVENKKDKN